MIRLVRMRLGWGVERRLLGIAAGLGILRPATEHPARRNALLNGAHIVWGVTLGLVVEQLLAEADPRSAVGEQQSAVR